MKKFNFRLNTPLRIKQLREQIEKQKLAKAIVEMDREANYLKYLESTNKNLHETMQTKLLNSVKAKSLSFYETYSADIISLINRQKTTVKQVNKIYEKTSLSFLESRKERQVLENIKQKKYDDYYKKTNREEQKSVMNYQMLILAVESIYLMNDILSNKSMTIGIIVFNYNPYSCFLYFLNFLI